MVTEKIDIIIIKGAPGTGKSQTAKSLAVSFPKGVRLEIDNLRSMIISVDWTNQTEHQNILNLSTNLVVNFLQLGFKPIIVIDTFSGTKLNNYLNSLYSLKNNVAIKVFGLYVKEEELKKRIESRHGSEFKNFSICRKLNQDTLKYKHETEFQIDTTGLRPADTAKIIYDELVGSN